MTWASKIIDFAKHLDIDDGVLPDGIEPMYPLKGDNSVIAERIVRQFYGKYYADNAPRKFIVGINPGRLGAGATGIPFTDTKRLIADCEIAIPEFSTHEPSSVFIYEMISAYGGPASFYSSFYITSVCPIGFVKTRDGKKAVNYNYYDSVELTKSIEPYVINKMKAQLNFGADNRIAYCLGTGKNFKYLNDLNNRQQFFQKIIPLEHPRYIMQYRNKLKAEYIDKYLSALSQ